MPEVMNIRDGEPRDTALLGKLLANSFRMLDDAIEGFLQENPKIPLEDGRLVLANPASLLIYAVGPDIKGFYNQTCALITRGLYASKLLDVEVINLAGRHYRCFYLNRRKTEAVFETTEFHSRFCKFVFVMRTD